MVVLDEALADFLEEDRSALGLLSRHPRLVVVRSFAKAHAMAGFRIGWAAGGAGTEELLRVLAPSGAVSAAAQAAAAAALEVADRVLPRRRAVAAADRARLREALDGTGITFPAGAAANVGVARIRPPRRARARLAPREPGDLRHPGTAYGDPRRIRAALRGPAAVDRLAAALLELPV